MLPLQQPHTPTTPSGHLALISVWCITYRPNSSRTSSATAPFACLRKCMSFAEVISVSAKFLQNNTIKTVGANAANFYESQPCMDLTEILANASQTVNDHLPSTRYTTLHNRSVIVPPVWLHTCVPPHYNPNHSHDQLRLIMHWSILGSRPILSRGPVRQCVSDACVPPQQPTKPFSWTTAIENLSKASFRPYTCRRPLTTNTTHNLTIPNPARSFSYRTPG